MNIGFINQLVISNSSLFLFTYLPIYDCYSFSSSIVLLLCFFFIAKRELDILELGIIFFLLLQLHLFQLDHLIQMEKQG